MFEEENAPTEGPVLSEPIMLEFSQDTQAFFLCIVCSRFNVAVGNMHSCCTPARLTCMLQYISPSVEDLSPV